MRLKSIYLHNASQTNPFHYCYDITIQSCLCPVGYPINVYHTRCTHYWIFPAYSAISLQRTPCFSPFRSLFFSFDMWDFILGGGNFHVRVGDVRDSSGLPAAAVKMGIESLHLLNLEFVLGK